MGLLEQTVAAIEPRDEAWRARAHERLSQLTMPYWALGRLLDLAEDLAGMTRSMAPPVSRRTVVVMAGDHGVALDNVSKYPQEVTVQMVANIAGGGAGINAIAAAVGARVVVVDMGVAEEPERLIRAGLVISKHIANGTASIADGPAMSREQAIRSIEAGIEVAQRFAADTDVFGTGDMGIGNTTPSSAICAVLCDQSVDEVTGRGTGIDDGHLRHKKYTIGDALEKNDPDYTDPLDVLAKVGGFEIGGIAGLILGAASLRKPVLIDGFISTAAALIAQGIAPNACDYMIASHRSVEGGHTFALEKLGKEPLLDLGLRLGEGTGAALAMPLLDAAVSVLTRMATFDEAAVTQAE